MIHPVVAYGDPILKKKALKINLDEPGELKSLIKDLWDTMYNAQGVGIAAPQIGLSKSIFVADFSFITMSPNSTNPPINVLFFRIRSQYLLLF